MDNLSQGFSWLASVLGRLGIPESYAATAALGLIYLLVTVVLLLTVFLVLRRGRRSGAEPMTPPPQGEGEVSEPGLQKELEAETAPAQMEEEKEEVVQELPAKKAEVPRGPASPRPEVSPPSLFDRMRAGLSKTQASLVGRIDALLRGGRIDAGTLEELEEILVTADFGMKTTQELVQALEKRRSRGEANDPEGLRTALKEEIRQRLRMEAAPLQTESASPFVIMVVGVNGVGKTTTIGKLARQLTDQGKKVIIGAGDTFRAAAAEQLAVWGERAGAEVIRHAEGADPAAVAFDSARAAAARGCDVLILDTAGRLHTKANLMEELKKVRRVLDREIPDAPHETLLVLDATTGQNALVQARLFKEAVTVNGIVVTKLDGTAKGGMIVAIGAELDLPVRYIGIGEGVEDLRPFDPDLFVEALFQRG